MPSISYEEIFSSAYLKASMYDVADVADISELQADELMCGWLKSAKSKPYIRKLFSSLSMNNDIREITYEMDYEVDEESDRDFVIDVLGYGILYEWILPKVNSMTNIAQMFSDSSSRFYSQSAHLEKIEGLKDSIKREQRSIISDRGYTWNSYLDGNNT